MAATYQTRRFCQEFASYLSFENPRAGSAFDVAHTRMHALTISLSSQLPLRMVTNFHLHEKFSLLHYLMFGVTVGTWFVRRAFSD